MTKVKTTSAPFNGWAMKFVVCVLTIFISSCATTKVNPVQAKQDAGINQEVKKQRVDGHCVSEKDGNGECAPSGVIEITEPYEVDSEVRDEFGKAVGLLNEEKYPEAIILLEDVTGKTAKFTAPYINLGIAYARSGDLKKAEENLNKALAINPRHPVALNELGLVYRKTGRYQKAREVYQSVLDIYPEFLPARQNLAVLCDIYLQDLSCALSEYQEYLKRVPDDKKMKIWVADVKSRMK